MFRRALLFIFLIFFPSISFAVSSGPVSPGTMANDASAGNNSWTNTGNAMVSDNVYVTGNAGLTNTQYLKATNFGFSLPVGATPEGIVVEVERRAQIDGSSDYMVDMAVNIVKANGSFGATNKADAVTHWPVADAYKTYGSSSDLWGETWTSGDINNSNFGVVVRAVNPTPATGCIGYVDHIRVTVYYGATRIKAFFGGGRIGSGSF